MFESQSSIYVAQIRSSFQLLSNNTEQYCCKYLKKNFTKKKKKVFKKTWDHWIDKTIIFTFFLSQTLFNSSFSCFSSSTPLSFARCHALFFFSYFLFSPLFTPARYLSASTLTSVSDLVCWFTLWILLIGILRTILNFFCKSVC